MAEEEAGKEENTGGRTIGNEEDDEGDDDEGEGEVEPFGT